MFRPVLPITVMMVAASSVAAEEPSSGPEQLLQNWAAAWPDASVETMVSFYDSKSAVAIESSGAMHKGLPAIRRMYRSAFEEVVWEKVRLKDLEVHRKGDVAWATCRFRADATLKANDARIVFTSQGSCVLRRTDSSWKIVLEHFSPIAGVPRIQPR